METTIRGLRLRGWSSVGLLLSIGTILLGCGAVVEGPQLEKVPEGLGYTTWMQSARLPLPGRSSVRQLGYVGSGDSPDDVVITEYAGPTTRNEAVTARANHAARYSSTEYGPLEELSIDRRPAWGWTETQRIRGEVVSRQYTAIVSYAATTYSIEMSGHRKELLDADILRRHVGSFRLRTKGSDDGKVLIASGLLLGGLVVFLWRIHSTRKRDG